MITATTEAGMSLRLALANNIVLRCRGLLGRPAPVAGEGLLIKRCRSIHTVGMAYSIDVVYLDRDFRIVGVSHSVPRGRLWVKAPPRRAGCTQVIELADREATRLGLSTGGRLLVAAPRASASVQFAQALEHAWQDDAGDVRVSSTPRRSEATWRMAKKA